MLKDIIEKGDKFEIIVNNQHFNDKDIKVSFLKLLEGSYFAPSFITADNNMLQEQLQKGFWIEISFDKVMDFKDYKFSKLLVSIKSKCNWLTFYRSTDNEFSGKCINLNLAYTTTDLFNEIKGKYCEK